jgi:hypothetical protein
MRIRILFIIYTLLISIGLFAQEERKMTFVLMINEALPVASIARSQIILDNGTKVSVGYIPGALIFSESNYQQLLEAKSDSLILAFDYYEYEGKKQKVYNFELPFHKGWLNQSYMVMKVYNLEKRKYKGVFEPLDKDRNYTFELDYPGGQMLRVRNKVKKKRNKD